MKKKIEKMIAVLIFLSGLMIFVYPYATDLYVKHQSEKVMEAFEKDLERMKNTLSSDNLISDIRNGEVDEQALSEEGRNLARLYKDMQSYNRRLVEEGQDELHDPFVYEVPAFDLTQYGFENNVIGIIEIEKMNVNMPLYLGASKGNMKKGAVVLSETSMPTGDKDTNMVVAAHRGYRGIRMFRDIQNMEYGDIIKITTPFDTLTYKVIEIKIVLPDEINEILIQKERSLVTLVTCHPYTKNTHRYLVVAELTDDEGREKNDSVGNQSSEDDKNGNEGSSNEGRNNDDKNSNESTGETDNNSDRNGKNRETIGKGDADSDGKESEKRIWLEMYMPIIGGTVVIAMIVIGMINTRKK